MTLEEQETIITQNRADDFVSIYTTNPHDLAYFAKKSEYTKIQEWIEDGEVIAATFHLPKDRANIRKIAKAARAPMTDEQKAALALGRKHAQKS